jgi:hypothetical protein
MRKVCGAVAVLVFSASVASAAPITIAWAPQSVVGVDGTDFNAATMLFPGFASDSLVSITDAVELGANVHSHGAVVGYSMDLLLDGVWTTLFSGSVNSLGEFAFANTGLSATFTPGIVTGLRFTSSPPQDYSFHDFNGAEFAFNTREDLAPVPEPASLLLLGSGLTGALVRARKRRKAE